MQTRLDGENVSTVAKPGENNRVFLKGLVSHLGQMGINNLMLEAGPTLVDGMIKEELIDKFVFYMAPKILGAGKLNFSKLEGSLKNLGTIALEVEEVEVIGDDLKVSITPKYNRNEIK